MKVPRGSVLLARFHTWYPQHLSALVFVSVGYVEPSAAPFDVGEPPKRISCR